MFYKNEANMYRIGHGQPGGHVEPLWRVPYHLFQIIASSLMAGYQSMKSAGLQSKSMG